MGGSGIYNEFQGGYMDGYIAAIAQDGSQLIYSTYLGTENDDQCHLIQVDKSDSIYIAGQTNGDWPIIGNVRYDEFAGQYIVKISPQLEVVELSTVFGSEFSFETQISPVAFLVDDCGHV